MGEQGHYRAPGGVPVSNLSRAIAKCHLHAKTEWTGYLTPSEILALVDAGAIPVNEPAHIEWIKKKVARGESRPTYFYFYPNAALLELLKERIQHKKVGTREKV